VFCSVLTLSGRTDITVSLLSLGATSALVSSTHPRIMPGSFEEGPLSRRGSSRFLILFGLPHIRLVFSAGTVFSLTTIQPEQCFQPVSAKFQTSEQCHNPTYHKAPYFRTSIYLLVTTFFELFNLLLNGKVCKKSILFLSSYQ